MIRRVHIRNYKSLADVRTPLERLTVLFGPNASGKSNFLDAFQLVSNLASARTLKEAFEPPYRGKPLESFGFGLHGFQDLLTQDSARFSIEVDVELSLAVMEHVNRQIQEMRPADEKKGDEQAQKRVVERLLRYRVEIEITPRSGMLRVSDEYMAALNQKGEPTGKRSAFLERVDEKLHLRMERQSHPTHYDRYLDHTILSRPHYPPHQPHMAALRVELSRWLFFYLEPRERMRLPNPVKEARHIGSMGEDLPAYLNTLKNIDERQFNAVVKSLRRIIPSMTGIEVTVNKLGEVELGLREGGSVVPARVLSEGTLRVLGLLALGGAKEAPAVIGFEEPENGVHPRRLPQIAELLKSRAEDPDTQIIVTTHSPLLLDEIPSRSLLVCRKEGPATTIQPYAGLDMLSGQGNLDGLLGEGEGAEGPTPVSQRLLRGDFDEP